MNKYKKIKLTNGKHVIVDSDMFEYLNQWSWCLSSNGYVVRTEYIRGSGRKNQKNIMYYMHRVILNTPSIMKTDHINRNKLDNRKCNLRSCTNSDNSSNIGIRKDNTSGYKGVCWASLRNRWFVRINKGGKSLYSGYFKDKNEAVTKYNEMARKYHGEFAYQNEVNYAE